ncbi:Uncharacterised protein [uncultured archaeon]|nr:Uncharacterised protein [uncultured archaeon]
MRKAFTRDELAGMFRAIGNALDRHVEVFLLGGGAMCFRGQKPATKDLDLVFPNHEASRGFAQAIRKLGFSEAKKLEAEYEDMKAEGIWENKDGFRLDIFVGKVCGALSLSEGMKRRSVPLATYGRLSVRLVSDEDVVLFKGITERDGDVGDVAIILRNEVDWNAILKECVEQSGERWWCGALHDKLAIVRQRHGISAPIMRDLLNLDRKVLIRSAYERRRKKGLSHDEAVKDLGKEFKRKEIEDSVA